MKKIISVCITLTMLLTFASCKKANNGNVSGTTSGSTTSSQTQSGTVSGGSSSSKAASNMPLYSGPEKEKSYSVKTIDYEFKKNNKKYRASYPQLSKDGKDYSKVNTLLKNTAMQTINSLGTSGSKEAEVKVSSHIYLRSDNFLSVSFSESTKSAANSDSVSSFRTVNYDLKNGKAVSASDMVKNNDALYKAVENAVKTSMSKKNAAKYTSSIIKSGLKSFTVYFKDSSMGISIKVPHGLDDHKELKLNYKDTTGFRTSNAAWSNFVK